MNENYEDILHELQLMNANFMLLRAEMTQVLNVILPHPDQDLWSKSLKNGIDLMGSLLRDVEKLQTQE